MKIIENINIPDFKFVDQNNEKKSISEIYSKSEKTVLLFLRYYGCTICQLDIMEYKKRYNEFKNKNMDVVIVLQSTPEIVSESDKSIPFTIVCDWEIKLYKDFEILPTKNPAKLMTPSLIKKISKAKKLGLEHGKYEGIETQLPAGFLIDKSGKVLYSKYASKLTDLPSIDEFLNM